MRRSVGLMLIAGVLVAPRAVSAQLAEEVAETRDGVVRFGYDAKPEVEICDQGVRMGDNHMRWQMRGSDYRETGCRNGYVEVELQVRDGMVRDVEVVGAGERSRSAVDAGDIPPEDAVDYLLSLVYEGATRSAAEDVIFPAMLADVDESWRPLLRIGRDASVHPDVRKNTLFWLGQAASDVATEGLTALAKDDEEAQEIRDAAIFALSQRPADESVPILMDLARTGEQAETRKRAMFWLAQSDDPRVIMFFEELLLRGMH